MKRKNFLNSSKKTERHFCIKCGDPLDAKIIHDGRQIIGHAPECSKCIEDKLMDNLRAKELQGEVVSYNATYSNPFNQFIAVDPASPDPGISLSGIYVRLR